MCAQVPEHFVTMRLYSFWATVYKTVRPTLSVRCLSVLSVCLSVTLVYCGQTVGWIQVKLGTEVGLGPGHIVLDGNPALPSPKRHSPQFSAHVCCGGQTSTSVAPCFVTAPMSLNGGQHNLGGCLASSGLVHYIYILGALPP